MPKELVNKTATVEIAPVKIAIEIENLCIRFGEKTVLDNINLKIHAGDFVALIGPNGSGKTTLLKAILGTIKSNSGSIRIFGKPVPNPEAKIGYIPQKLNLEKSLAISVREFLSLRSKETHGWFWKRHRNVDEKFGRIIEKLNLTSILDAQVYRLSGGELQKTLIAFSLLEEPDLLLMDEATEGVDFATESAIYNAISEVQKSKNMTVVMVSHDLAMVNREAARVIAIGNGRICCEGAPNEVLTEESLLKAYGIHSTPYCHHHKHEK